MDSTMEETEAEMQHEFMTQAEMEAEFNSPTPEPRNLLPRTPEPVEFEKLIDQLDVIPSTNIQLDLVPCPICARKFVPDSLAKHVGICEKIQMKKRKVFDSSRQRIEGTEMASYRPPPALPAMPSHPQRHNSIDSQTSTSKASPPKTTPLPRKFERTPSLERTPMKDVMSTSASSKMPSNKRVTAPAQSEMCPYCERTFGFKAYDRHVDWCKEKALLKQMSTNNKETVSAAKERLQARIKYKAPCLKTKRQLTREKYSGGSLSCSGSTNSLNDIGTPLFKQKDYMVGTKSDKKNSFSMANSMTSSMTSESGLSDRNYDPFMSAKRQLEELFSPTTAGTATTTTNNITTSKNNHNSNNNNKLTTLNSKNSNSNLMTSSMKVTPIPKPSTPTAAYPNRSSFRRTSSLRLSKKVSKPLFSQNIRSNIQRGLSPDDGPVSPHFVRANEYDEIPIKSAYNALHGNKPVLTSKASTPIRSTPPKTPSFDDTPILRRNNSADLRKNLKLELKSPNTPAGAPDFSVSKTDSLAVFLKYEKDLKDSSSCLTEKDLKDKSNTCLSKRSSIINESKENIVENTERLPEIINKTPSNTAPATPNNNFNRISPPLKLEPIQKGKIISYNNNNNDLICDALGLKVTKLSDSDNSSSGSSSSTSAKSSSKRDDTPEKIIPSNRSSGEQRRNILRRQVKLSKDNILYDFSPDSDPYSEECDQKISQLEAERDNNPHFKRNISNDTGDLESIFDDFDFEEFISSFEDDENYPIFKDYKNILLSRTINDSKNIAARSESDTDFGGQTPRNNSSTTLTDMGLTNNNNKEVTEIIKVPAGLKVSIDELSPAEKDLLKSVSELNDMCTENPYPVDSDDLSSIEGFPYRKQAGSKMSADSAYGSLSRQSPPERATNRRTTKTRALGLSDMLRMPDIQQNKQTASRSHQLRPRESNLSMSSSGSESSLPPINSNLKTQKMELHPHNEKLQQSMSNTSNNNNNNSSSGSEYKLSKFCHECGSRFPSLGAKFCMECGVKRIVIE